MKISAYLFSLVSSLALCCYTNAHITAQIVPDGTLPVNSVVTPDGNTSVITGGTVAGGNLFHSFSSFSLPAGNEAYFNNALSVENIFSRVTGKNLSNIDGLIRANGTANLFLINPNGIIFGPNASLNIGGSFFASTADQINFKDGSFFSAKEPQSSPLLTINVPIGLQFGDSSNGSIVNQSVATIGEQVVGLQVNAGETLALVGGNVSLDGGILQAPAGRVELGGLGEAGTIQLNSDGSLNFPNEVARADVLLTNSAGVNVRAGNGGTIAINARNLEMSRGSTLEAGIAPGLGSVNSQAGDITILTTDSIALSDDSVIANTVPLDAFGNSGDINIAATSLNLRNGANVSIGIYGNGKAGDVNLSVSNAASFDGVGSNGKSTGIYNLLEQGAIGEGGSVNLTASSLTLTNGALVKASTLGQGNAGNVNVNVRDIASFEGAGSNSIFTGVYSRSEANEAVGNGGNINIEAGSLFVINGAVISTSTQGQGNAGNIRINVRNDTVLDGLSPLIKLFLFDGTTLEFQQSSGVFSTVKRTGVGTGGNIILTTGSLSITNSAVLIARTDGKGPAGNIVVNATDFVTVAGVGSDFSSSGLLTPTEPEAIGRGGDITVNTNLFRVSDGAVVNAQTLNNSDGGNITINANIFEAIGGGQVISTTGGEGRAGNIRINATDKIVLSGSDPTFPQRLPLFDTVIVGNNEGANSGLFASTRQKSTGAGGNLTVQTGQLIVQDGGEVSVSAAGLGAAGNLEILTNLLRLDNGNLTARTNTGNFGNINIQANDIRLRRGSNIATDAGNSDGGNIRITTGTLAALENSDITADAQQGRGGQVFIDAQGIFGTAYRLGQNLATSDITATSELGAQFNGIVEIDLSEVNLNAGLIDLPANFVNAERLIVLGCETDGNASRFINTGTGGVPPEPSEAMASNAFWDDLRPVQPLETASAFEIAPPRTAAPATLVEAQGWVKDGNGNIVLTADVPVATPHTAWQTSAGCDGKARK